MPARSDRRFAQFRIGDGDSGAASENDRRPHGPRVRSGPMSRAVVASLCIVVAGCPRPDDGGAPDAAALPDAPGYPAPRDDLVPAIGADDTLEIAAWNLENFPADPAQTPAL